MTKEEHLIIIDYIKNELYEYIVKDEVDKYYLPTLEYCKKLIEEKEDDR